MCVLRKNKARLRKHCCHGKAISITYSECVFVALVIQHANACTILYCHTWPVRLYNIFFTLSDKRFYFRKKKVIEYKMCFDFIYNKCLKYIQF